MTHKSFASNTPMDEHFAQQRGRLRKNIEQQRIDAQIPKRDKYDKELGDWADDNSLLTDRFRNQLRH